MTISILGSTILQLERQTNSSTAEIASLFTWKALGLLAGNIFIGLVFDRFPPESILSLACFAMSAAVAATPFCTSLVTLTLVIVINGLMHGILGAGRYSRCYIRQCSMCDGGVPLELTLQLTL